MNRGSFLKSLAALALAPTAAVLAESSDDGKWFAMNEEARSQGVLFAKIEATSMSATGNLDINAMVARDLDESIAKMHGKYFVSGLGVH